MSFIKEKLKYSGTAITNQNHIQEEIKNRVKSENTCYQLLQYLLPVILRGFETWSLTLREDVG
jgi:hypothetical protein